MPSVIHLVDQMMRTAGVDVNTGKTDLGVLYGKPQSVVSKEKTFMELFRELTGTENNDVEDKVLVDELVKTGKFSDEEARKYIQKPIGKVRYLKDGLDFGLRRKCIF